MRIAAAAALVVAAVVALGVATTTQAAAPFGGATVRVNQVTTGNQNEPTIAVNPANPRNLVAGSITFETGTGQCAAYSSTDRGQTWTHQVLPNVPVQAPGGGSLFTAAGDPIVAFDAGGTAYYLCMELTPGPRTQYLFRSTDGGQTWVGPALVMGTPGTTDDDKGFMTVDDHPGSTYAGNVYAVATRGPCSPGQLRFARSIDGGLSFQADQQVNDSSLIAFSGNIAVGADGAVYVGWGALTPCGAGQSLTALMVDKSTDGGQTFGALSGGTDHAIRVADLVESVRPDPNRGGSTVFLGAHPTTAGTVYAVWAEDPAGVDDSDVLFARSLDGGDTWSAPIRVNDDVNPAGEYYSQFWPTMTVDPVDGEIDIVWYSDQNDANRSDGTALVDLYFASSTNGGVSFGPSVRLTPSSSTRSGFFGDYIAVDALGGVAHPIWTDTTLTAGNQDVATTQVGGADLRIAKKDTGFDPAVAGANLTYTIEVTNDGPADAIRVLVTDVLPSGASFVSSSVACPGTSTRTCLLGDLESGDSTAFTITVRPGASLVYDAGGPVTLTNTATADSNQDDPDGTDNSASETTLVTAETDLSIAGFAAVTPPSLVAVGQPVELTLRKVIENGGPSSPVDVNVTRTATAPVGSTVTPTASSETASAVATGQPRTIDETFTITCGAPGPQTFSFVNTITPVGASDPDSSDNGASVSVTVNCVVPVAINVKPGSFPNGINLNGAAPVAVLTTAAGEYGLPLAFDAATIDPLSVRFGPAALVLAGGGASAVHGAGRLEDARELDEKTRDKDLDMVFQFRVAESGLTASSTEACVSGLYAGAGGAMYLFFGCDTVKVAS